MFDSLEAPVPDLTLDQIGALAEQHYGLMGTPTRLGGERDLNVLVNDGHSSAVLKVTDAAHDEIPAAIAALRHVAATDPRFPVPRVIPSASGEPWVTVAAGDRAYRVSAFSFLSGECLPPGPLDRTRAHGIGASLGRLQHALRGFMHPGALRPLLWDARRASYLVAWVGSIPDPALQPVVEGLLDRSAALRPRLDQLPTQVIHHDFNRANLLANAQSEAIAGVLDFGDLLHGPRIQDVAVAIAYAALDHPDPLEPATAVLSGFLDTVALEPEEIDLLRELVSIRFAQSLTIAHHRVRLHPHNTDYIASDTTAVTGTLDRWLRLEADTIDAAFRSVAGFVAPAETAKLVQRRSTSLWSGLRLAHDSPLHLVASSGVWLEDRSGEKYLDAYNNVVQVGHSNARVINAATVQARRLNTNTRYLTEPVVALAEAITARLPGSLSVCFFVNSGSEATDLAWRIARTVTGRAGAITTTHAYHGWTEAMYAISPEERPVDDQPSWHTTIAPPHADGPSISDALEGLAATGHEPAAIWFDATFSSDGIATPPASYLDHAIAEVRSAGGLYIADEVQGGLGRVGPGFWGFTAGTAVPDIVTLGKPLGNGYPIGAVITSAEIAATFAERGYFFSTFGGNPVSAAAALMVLRITDELELSHRAQAVGQFLRNELPGLLVSLGDDVEIRGSGTFLGADLRGSAIAEALVEAMRVRGVLVSRTGPFGSVVKIRPPLVFDLHHAERLLEATAGAVRTIGG